MKKNIIRKLKMAAYYSFLGVIFQGIILNVLLAASPMEGQNLKDVKVSISLNNVSFEQALLQIEKSTDFKFFYVKEDIPINEKVTLDVTSESLYEVLKGLASQYSLMFQRINNQIVIKKSTNHESISEQIIPVENGSVKGYVTDADTKEALQGVTVKINGTTIGTFTDKRGYYEINNLKPGKYSVVASYVGYAASSKEITISSGKTAEVNFQLGEGVVNLDEVTVTGSVSERAIRTSANPISVLNAKEIETRNLTYLTDVLATVPGVSISPLTDGVDNFVQGAYNGYFSLRGSVSGSLASTTSVKYYVDGVEVYDSKSLAYIDPNQIEKIEVSKGPMSSTLYGAGSSSGVIQIFTKKGKGDTHIDFKTMFTTREDKYVYGNPMTSQYSLDISGGKSDFGYKLGGSYGYYPVSKRYNKNNGIDENDYNLSGNIYGNVGNVKIQFGFNYGFKNSGFYSSDAYYFIALAEGWSNPEKLIGTSSTNTSYGIKFTDLDLNLNIKHIITDNIYQNLSIGSSGINNNYVYNDPTTTTSGSYYPYWSFEYSKQTVKYFINWAQPLFTDFSADVTGGIDIRRGKSTSTTNYYTTSYNEIALSRTSTTLTTSTQSVSVSNTTGIFAEGVWGYKNNLFLTTGFRTETDNSYGGNIGWYPMSRFGLTYVYSMGDFTFKPRISYGKSTESVNPQYKVTRTNPSGSYTLIFVGNPDLKPQNQNGYELGMDIFFTDKYSLTFTFYNQKVQDMITSTTILDAVNKTITTTYTNIANITNKGLEISAKCIIDPFTLDVNYGYVDSRYGVGGSSTSVYNYDGGRVIGIPSTTIFARLSYKLPECISLCNKRGNIDFEVSYKGNWLAQDYYSYYKYYCENGTYNSSLIKYYKNVDGYTFVNMNLSYPVMNNLLLYADVKNLLDYQKINLQFSAISGRRITFGFKFNY